MEAEESDPEQFYLTLPSNDGSKKYFPGNKTNSWKNHLDRRIRLEGTWRVGLWSLSVPTVKKIVPAPKTDFETYLDTLKDSDLIFTAGRVTLSGSSGNWTIH